MPHDWLPHAHPHTHRGVAGDGAAVDAHGHVADRGGHRSDHTSERLVVRTTSATSGHLVRNKAIKKPVSTRVKTTVKKQVEKSVKKPLIVEKSEGCFAQGMDADNSRFTAQTLNSGLIVGVWTHKAGKAGVVS